MNIINVPDPASLLLATLPPRPLPAAPGVAVPPSAVTPMSNTPVVSPVSANPPVVNVDPLAVLLQATDTPDVPVPTADLARRYAESGTLTQQSAKNIVQSQTPPVALGAADAKLLNGLAQAYRQDASAIPLPQPANVARELANATLPNAPGTAGNAPAIIVVDGKLLPLSPAQTAAIRDALATTGSLDPRGLANILRAPQPAESALRAQPASGLKEMAGAQITQPAALAPQQQAQLAMRPLPGATPLPVPADATSPTPGAPLPLQQSAQTTSRPLPGSIAAPTQHSSASNTVPPSASPQVTAAQHAVPALPQATAAAILIDGRTIPLNQAQIAAIRANLGPALRLPAGPLAGTDAENPLTSPAAQRVADVGESERVQVINASTRAAVEDEERRERPQPKDIETMLAQAKPHEKVEAIRAIRQDHVVPYEPQLITAQPRQDQLVLAPAPDHVILQGRAPDEAAPSAITGLVIAVAPGLTRDDVTAEYHQGGYRISFAGSPDHIVLHTGAGLSAQLIFADGTSLRLQLDHD